MAKKKYYVIFLTQDKKNVIFPIKSIDEDYLAEFPNFFGGTDDSNIGLKETLIKEVKEESQFNIEFTGDYEEIYKNGIYHFYVSTGWKLTESQEAKASLDKIISNPDNIRGYFEMQSIVQKTIDELCIIINNLKNIRPGGNQFQKATKQWRSMGEYNDGICHTKCAFNAFLKKNNKGELDGLKTDETPQEINPEKCIILYDRAGHKAKQNSVLSIIKPIASTTKRVKKTTKRKAQQVENFD